MKYARNIYIWSSHLLRNIPVVAGYRRRSPVERDKLDKKNKQTKDSL